MSVLEWVFGLGLMVELIVLAVAGWKGRFICGPSGPSKDKK